jgi:hypothetical protein
MQEICKIIELIKIFAHAECDKKNKIPRKQKNKNI